MGKANETTGFVVGTARCREFRILRSRETPRAARIVRQSKHTSTILDDRHLVRYHWQIVGEEVVLKEEKIGK